MDVHVLWHVHRSDDGGDEKLIGIYSSRDRAVEASRRLAMQPGFAHLPELRADEFEGDGGFVISTVAMDEDGWADGYSTD